MITTLAAVAIVVGVLILTFWVRDRDLPVPEPVPPDQHLQDRKARIYENLRDLQFEYRLGKLSDADYQRSKQSFQAELAHVLAEIDAILGRTPAGKSAAVPKPPEPTPSPAPAPAPAPEPVVESKPEAPTAPAPAKSEHVCGKCGAKFEKAMKFCGECGEVMG